jgi:hypothetical protein
MSSISHKYKFLIRTPEELAQTMKHYEEVGVPGAIGSVDVVHVKWSNCPAVDFIWSTGKSHIHLLHLNAFLTLIVTYLVCLIHSLKVRMISTLLNWTQMFSHSARDGS